MITRFKIEAEGKTKVELEQIFRRAQLRLFNLYREGDDENEWKCTQDVVTGVPGNYTGRQVWKRKVNENAAVA